MSVIIASGVADANDILGAIFGMFYSQGFSNVSGGTRSQVAISNNYASLIVHKSPTPGPSKSSSSYSTWAATPTPTGSQVVAVFQAFIPGTVGVAGNLSALFTSTNRISVGSSGSLYVAVEWVTGKVAKSLDGITWALTGTFSGGRSYARQIAWSGTQFVLVENKTTGNDYANKVWASADGATWAAKTLPADGGGSGSPNGSPASNGNGVVVVPFLGPAANYMALRVSSDGGNTWAAVAPQGQFGTVVWTGTQFYTETTTNQSDGHDGCAVSSNGLTWSFGSQPNPMFETACIAGHGNTLVTLAARGLGQFTTSQGFISTNAGSSWSPINLPAGGGGAAGLDWSAPFAYGAGLFVLVQDNGNPGSSTYFASADGVSWTQYALPSSSKWNSLVWTGNQFVLTGSSGACLVSANGTTWANTSTTVANTYITQADVAAFNASLPTGAPYFYIVGSAEDPNLNPTGASSFTTSPFNVLVRGSLLELTAPPTSRCVRGSFREVTAPPLPFTSNGSLVERVSSITLPLTDLGAGGALQHLGTPFKTVGG